MDSEHYLSDIRAQFHTLKTQADRAIVQCEDAELFRLIDSGSNSIAIIMKHMAGNMRSRWTDFLTSDGEKPDRHRDMEFVITDSEGKDILLSAWEHGWQCLFDSIDSLTGNDLSRTIIIRSENHSVVEALHRQLTHYAGHVGQIVLLAKHLKGARWQSLSIPRGQSEQFNTMMKRKS